MSARVRYTSAGWKLSNEAIQIGLHNDLEFRYVLTNHFVVIRVFANIIGIMHPSLSPRPKTNPSADRFQ